MEKVFTICVTIILICFMLCITAGMSYQEHNEQLAIIDLVKEGADPIEAACAIKPLINSADVLCSQVISRSSSAEDYQRGLRSVVQ